MRLASIFSTFLLLTACSTSILNIRNIYKTDATSSLSENVIKLHLNNGGLIIMNKWEINEQLRQVSGKGNFFNAKRSKLTPQPQNYLVPFDDIVLIETNVYEGTNVISPALLTFSTIISAATLPCLFDPKACFGSCPTYYLHAGDSLLIKAEGFSSSITKSMEAEDVDYLASYEGGQEVRLELMNEALETHYIRRSDLVILEKRNGQQVYKDDHKFYYVSGIYKPKGGALPEVISQLADRDGTEYFLPADESNLVTREEVILDFEPQEGERTGVILTQRQSLMTTYLFYQSMAYMGSKAGEFIAAYERASPWARSIQKNMYEILGGVEVHVWINDKWEYVGLVEEQGPIVSDTHILPIRMKGSVSKVKLTMTKGLWRIDQVALGTIEGKGESIVIQPETLLVGGQPSTELLERLNAPDQLLVNNPGTSYTLVYELPEGTYDVFLKSQGYYTEWMRDEWLAEEDPAMVNLLVKKPEKWLELMAPKYKIQEAGMEKLFWSSKFSTQQP